VTELSSARTPRTRLRALAFAATVLVLVQAALGMVVNLYVTIPTRHSGAQPSDFFGGSFDSIVWSIGHGAVALAFHAAFGLALVVVVTGTAIYALRLHHGAIAIWSSIAALLVIGAGFNGASFLDFNNNVNSLIMALLAFAAVSCYSAVMFLLVDAPRGGD
jgi:heme A synthase